MIWANEPPILGDGAAGGDGRHAGITNTAEAGLNRGKIDRGEAMLVVTIDKDRRCGNPVGSATPLRALAGYSG
jgi:hypothetical protein